MTVFGGLKFTSEGDCADVKPEWVLLVPELNKGFLAELTPTEFNLIDKERLLAYLKTYKSARLLRRVSKISTDEAIKAFCEEGLKDNYLELNTTERYGGKRRTRMVKRKTLRNRSKK